MVASVGCPGSTPALEQAEGANDRVTVNGLEGNDVLNAVSLPASAILLTLNGGMHNDTLTGGQGNDVLLGESEDDVITGGLGADTIDCGPGTTTRTATARTPSRTASLSGRSVPVQRGGQTP